MFRRTRPYVPFAGEGALRLFSCGRLTAEEGHFDVVRAIGALRCEGLLIELRVAGEDATRDKRMANEILAFSEQVGVADSVRLLGVVPQSRILKELERAHAFVLASHEESFGNAVAEAMAMSVPTTPTTVLKSIITVSGCSRYMKKPMKNGMAAMI